jgi:hypothetical protein
MAASKQGRRAGIRPASSSNRAGDRIYPAFRLGLSLSETPCRAGPGEAAEIRSPGAEPSARGPGAPPRHGSDGMCRKRHRAVPDPGKAAGADRRGLAVSMPPSARPPEAEWHIAGSGACPSASATALRQSRSPSRRERNRCIEVRPAPAFRAAGCTAARPAIGIYPPLPGFLCADTRLQRLWGGLATAVTRGEGRWSRRRAHEAEAGRR